MSTYEADIVTNGTTFTQAYMAGKTNFTVTFRWAFITQEIVDDLTKAVAIRRNAIPLIDTATGEIIRDYDYVAYWSTVPTGFADILEWLQMDPIIPFLPVSMSDAGKVYYIQNENSFATQLIALFDHYAEQLYWQVIAEKDSEKITMALRPGGQIKFSDGVSLIFLSDREAIHLNDLNYVTMRIGVPND